MKGLFIVMEGSDGSGKTTQINLLEQYLKEAGYECLITREPGGTVIGEEVRELILNPEYKEMSPVTEMLLYAASRAQLVHEVIGPALEAGRIVISDRFVDSSIVYQGIARNLGISTVAAVNAPGIGIYRPDGIFFIDLSEAEGIRRKKNQKKLDRMEQESIDFHHLVSEGYRKVLAERPEVIKIDGGKDIDVIQKKIRNHVDELLKKKNR
ncbi:MAG: dTMP kinase [Anaerobutyricum soehngenii]|nr:dTMP kinase [Anaerobutyricum soehngenii]